MANFFCFHFASAGKHFASDVFLTLPLKKGGFASWHFAHKGVSKNLRQPFSTIATYFFATRGRHSKTLITWELMCWIFWTITLMPWQKLGEKGGLPVLANSFICKIPESDSYGEHNFIKRGMFSKNCIICWKKSTERAWNWNMAVNTLHTDAQTTTLKTATFLDFTDKVNFLGFASSRWVTGKPLCQ